MKINTLLAGILLLFISCNTQTDEQQKETEAYFDLRAYFRKEAERLTAAAPLVTKTVSINDSSETKSLKITDWKRELSAISDADINKTSWKGVFTIEKKKNLLVYSTNDEKVSVKKVVITFKDDMPSGFLALIRNSNALYTSTDSLSYYPDSLYRLTKTQNIRFLTKKKYKVSILFR